MKLLLAVLSDEMSASEGTLLSLMEEVGQAGAILKLTGIPIVTPMTARWQLLTGAGPGKTGMFDGVRPYRNTVVKAQPDRDWDNWMVWRAAEAQGATVLKGQRMPGPPLPDLVVLTGVGRSDLDILLLRAGIDNAALLLVAPCSRQTASNVVNLNDFLRDQEILEADADGGINWRESLAYHVGRGQVWLNLMGREPEGTVFPGEEYEQVRSVIARTLLEGVCDPETGEPVIRRAYRKEEIYPEDETHFVEAPDLVVVFRDDVAPSPISEHMGFDGEVVRSGSEGVDVFGPGMMLGWGPGVIRAGWKGSARLIDVAPTVLALLGVPALRSMSGCVVYNMLESRFRRQQVVAHEQPVILSAADEALLTERLRALGYLE